MECGPGGGRFDLETFKGIGIHGDCERYNAQWQEWLMRGRALNTFFSYRDRKLPALYIYRRYFVHGGVYFGEGAGWPKAGKAAAKCIVIGGKSSAVAPGGQLKRNNFTTKSQTSPEQIPS